MLAVGIDVGSISAKAALLKDGELAGCRVILTGYNARNAGRAVYEGLLQELRIDPSAVRAVLLFVNPGIAVAV